ncbi:double-strand break repair protein AddB [Sphingomonas sp.]|uniref:double-strand break repair protein AddB n=1 Tax=Sphingomonas sp. TaxID=28214 RepID=UPI0025D7D446|nr:double-strand break repair protein AddB [Sphingomonas sp.]MBV9528114.1 double-strand break repair protein AddB [Sphingomonas sp.]
MSDAAAERPGDPSVYTIPAHRSFADALADGLIQRFGGDPLELARGRILLPNNRGVRAVTDAFVRASGSGLLLPRLIPIGDPEIDERIGGALGPIDAAAAIPPAIDPLDRLLALAEIVAGEVTSSAEAFRLAQELGRTLDALLVQEIEPRELAEAAADAPDLAVHWQVSLDRLRAIIEQWPARLALLGRIDLADRHNRLLRRLAGRWRETPPQGFTIAAGITTAAPAVARLLRCVSRMPDGMVVLPALALERSMPSEEWDALDADNGKRGQTHPQFHLKQLLDRMDVARGDVKTWPAGGRAASPAARGRAVDNAMTLAAFTDKWSSLNPAERRLTGVRAAEFADPAAEAQGIALALREALETPGRTAALVTPDRTLARRVSALLRRWGVDADDSAGRSLSETAPGTLLLAVTGAVAEDFAPVPLLALLKHPLVGGEGPERLGWLEQVRTLDLALRGPRPAAGVLGLDGYFKAKGTEVAAVWKAIRARLAGLEGIFASPLTLGDLASALSEAAERLAGDAAWRGQDGRMAAELVSELQAKEGSKRLTVAATDAVPLLRQLLDGESVRPPYGGHPRIFIWGLLEARLQHADLMVLGGLNEGVWPAAPQPNPWLAPKIRSNLGLPGLEFRIGLSAHDFASALGAPSVLITRARRDSRSPTVASRLWLRLEAMTGGITRDVRLERLVEAIDVPDSVKPADRPAPSPPGDARPRKISVTSVDRLKADPFAFYAREVLKLPSLDAVDADHTAAWKGTAVHLVLQEWQESDDCTPDRLLPRAQELLGRDIIHPMLRALWSPRLIEAIRWVEEQEKANREQGRRPLVAEKRGEAVIAGVTLHGKADRIDKLADGGLGIVDYKTGKAPAPNAVNAGFALQLGLLGLIAEAGGFDAVSGLPRLFEYWSLTKYADKFGRRVCPDKGMGPDEFLAHAARNFEEAAGRWLTGDEAFTAKLHPAFAPYGEYDQLMRLEEWYGRG